MKKLLLILISLFNFCLAQQLEIKEVYQDSALLLAKDLMPGTSYTVSINGQVISFQTLIDSSQYVLYNDFNHLDAGQYPRDVWQADWKNSPRFNWEMGLENMVRITETQTVDKTIRVRYPKDRYALSLNGENGALWYVDLSQNDQEGYDELYLSFKVYFEKDDSGDFQWKKGGKFHGLKWGGFDDSGRIPCLGEGGYFTNKWIEEGKVVFYLYHPNQETIWGDDIPMKHADGSDVILESGTWYTFTNYIKLNSSCNFDGEIKTWIDGELVLSQSGFRFRVDETLKIDEFDFSTFFGGGDASYAPSLDQYIQYDDFRIYIKK